MHVFVLWVLPDYIVFSALTQYRRITFTQCNPGFDSLGGRADTMHLALVVLRKAWGVGVLVIC